MKARQVVNGLRVARGMQGKGGSRGHLGRPPRASQQQKIDVKQRRESSSIITGFGSSTKNSGIGLEAREMPTYQISVVG